MLVLWEKIYRYEQGKFARATYLDLDDLHTEFTDNSGAIWEIVGQMENTDLVCKNVSSGHYYIWDKWKVSQLKKPECHTVVEKKIPKSLKPLTKKLEEKKKPIQLSLSFDEPLVQETKTEIEEEIIVTDEEIASTDLDEFEIVDIIFDEPIEPKEDDKLLD